MHSPARTKMDQDQSQVIMLCASLSAPQITPLSHWKQVENHVGVSQSVSSLAPPPRVCRETVKPRGGRRETNKKRAD